MSRMTSPHHAVLSAAAIAKLDKLNSADTTVHRAGSINFKAGSTKDLGFR